LVAKSSGESEAVQSKKQFESIDEYIKNFPKEVQSILGKMRLTVRKAAPEAEETISYQMPTFKLNGSVLVYFAAFKRHIGFYPPPPREFNTEVSKYEGPKGSLRFPTDELIPYDLVTRIVLSRKKAILENKK
jgi:uncharacterized protein YdhG (YjbR/CyaY superfamily)